MTHSEQAITRAYDLARERYATLGVDTEAALSRLAQVALSLHCWQGDDVGGFERGRRWQHLALHRLADRGSPALPAAEPFALPAPAPALAGGIVIVTGSGRRLRDIHARPEANLGAVAIDADGQTATLYTAPSRLFQHVTSEFNSHLAVHQDQVARTGTNFHALIHAQPPHLVHLSHIPAYRDHAYINRKLLRWEPETIVNLPQGIGVLPYCLPGSPAMMAANVDGLRTHNVVLWGKHGVMARSDLSVTRAVDRVEYAETAALYEYMNLVNHGLGEGLTIDELREIVQAFHVDTTLV